MSPHKKTTRKAPAIEASRSGSSHVKETDSPREVYVNMNILLEKGKYPLKWGEVFHMF